MTTLLHEQPLLQKNGVARTDTLNYLLGQATGSAYTVQRSLSMAAALSKIGLSDSPETRAYITEKITQAFNDPSSLEAGSSSVRDTLLMGPGGAVKMQTIWQGRS
jgi:hypothetical protein